MKYVMYNWTTDNKIKKAEISATQTTTAKIAQLNYCKINKLVPGKIGQVGSKAIKEYEEMLLSKKQLELTWNEKTFDVKKTLAKIKKED